MILKCNYNILKKFFLSQYLFIAILCVKMPRVNKACQKQSSLFIRNWELFIPRFQISNAVWAINYPICLANEFCDVISVNLLTIEKSHRVWVAPGFQALTVLNIIRNTWTVTLQSKNINSVIKLLWELLEMISLIKSSYFSCILCTH